ncbi:MAG: cyclic nucleotide-binding domain-containing protein [Algoriphagus sp.]|jgi:CRP-like cAMP-binding protein|uniref:Crp/Fnr family transcriptional regulator n=1 Tax=Algoriphagus sp. TaxID=1872435 RepID=UPI002721EE35|nr:cyclic nucleotide-binding domain-containing protein [Algoriphagus sp.]MDO8968874.1 cyclic nucleotide-binding domain-containing protein [Algoriphagus sp.]MDP2040689.1 cyclic nucleotide-binding domain-containing protein [Algoriphagus sp.]MDP3201357.1 cyclic nucleotide-binding domain-containing protein [Algoriphagus sp.]MDP3472995.1 cyclic nucleotide-binding domain-containing protein [Algoriphagus sp.]
MINPFSKTYDGEELMMFDFLQRIKFFERLRQKELMRFLPAMHHRKYVCNEVVFFSKDPSQALYLVKSGKVNLTIDIKDNFEMIMEVTHGGCFGENSLLENAKRTYTALIDSEEAELIVIPHFAIQEIFDSNPKIKAKMMTSLAEYYNGNNQRLFRSYRESFGFFSLRQMFE